MPSLPDDFNALEDLVQALETAREGSRELDLRIEYCIGIALNDHFDLAQMMIEEGFSWENVSEAIDCKLPPYTTSLDSRLDDENVVFVMRSNKRDKWGAIHRAKTGVETLAWANTEALARRASLLKAMQEAARRTMQPGHAPPPQRPAKPRSEIRPSAAAQAETPHAGESDTDTVGRGRTEPVRSLSAVEPAKPLREAGDWKILF